MALALTLSSLSPAAAYAQKINTGTDIDATLGARAAVNADLYAPSAEAALYESMSAGEIYARTAKTEYSLPGISNKSVWGYKRKTVKINGSAISHFALKINGITYLDLEGVARQLGNASYSYNTSTRTATLSMSGLYLTAADGGFVTYANDRPIFTFSPNALMSNGRMYIGIGALTRALGISYKESESTVELSGGYSPLRAASAYYRSDEVFWLARIIEAEAGGESLLGKIAVGDVILNRTRSSDYPNTIYGVIFDKKYGIQFSPVADGRIYNTPSYASALAAKICLEGTSLSDNALFFLNPKTAHSSWIVRSRDYAYTIGGHDFYL